MTTFERDDSNDTIKSVTKTILPEIGVYVEELLSGDEATEDKAVPIVEENIMEGIVILNIYKFIT